MNNALWETADQLRVNPKLTAAEYSMPVLSGALPRGYAAFEPDLLAELVKIFDRPAIKAATGDVFGRIYEYFLNKFAMSGAQEGGEFFTPPPLVHMIVNVIEPDHGLVLDPAYGSAGMFVQTGHFIEDVRHAVVNDSVTFHDGQEKSDTKLARMNLVVHGLDASNIRQCNTFYDLAEYLIGQCDFVMASSASDAGNKDRGIREQLVKTGHVARTVADCFKFRKKIGLDVALEALQEGWRAKRLSMDELWRYATLCRVANVMRPYMESLS